MKFFNFNVLSGILVAASVLIDLDDRIWGDHDE